MEIIKDIFGKKESEKDSQNFIDEITNSITGGNIDAKELNKKNIKKFVNDYRKNILKGLVKKK
jgi:UDP-galactopyranose mutase